MIIITPTGNAYVVCIASPGPLTTQPKIDMLIGSLTQENLLSICFTVLITSNCCLAQEGQEITLRPVFLIFKAFKISSPTLISFNGSSERTPLRYHQCLLKAKT